MHLYILKLNSEITYSIPLGMLCLRNLKLNALVLANKITECRSAWERVYLQIAFAKTNQNLQNLPLL